MTLLHARYMRQQFARHAHDDFPVGVIEAGALGFEYRGEHLIAPEGSVNLANPGEAHTGRAAAETGWTYRMFYLDLGLMRRIAAEITGRACLAMELNPTYVDVAVKRWEDFTGQKAILDSTHEER